MCVERVCQVVAMPASEEGTAIVEVGGVRHRVSTALLVFEGIEVRPGDWLQTHTGLAVRILPEADARRLISAYEEMQAAATEAN